MRKKLGKICGERMSFKATVERYGSKKAFKGPDLMTILLKDVIRTDTHEIVCDHLWFTAGKSWEGLVSGDQVSFDARVSMYEKGYKGRREDVFKPVTRDYRLERPTKVKKIPTQSTVQSSIDRSIKLTSEVSHSNNGSITQSVE